MIHGLLNGRIIFDHECKGYILFYSKKTYSFSGTASMSTNEKLMAVANLANGVTIYSIPDLRPAGRIKIPIKVNFPLSIAFAMQIDL